MASRRAVLLLALLALAAAAPRVRAADAEEDDEYETVDDPAFLLVRRTLGDAAPLEGKPVAVTIEIHNAGGQPATGVKLTEAAWPAGYTVEGALTASFASIPAGASATHTYTVTAAAAGAHTHGATVVAYRPEAGGAAVTTSSAPLGFEARTRRAAAAAWALGLGARATGGALATGRDWVRAAALGGTGLALVLGARSWGALAAARTQRRRRKALKDLGVADLKDE